MGAIVVDGRGSRWRGKEISTIQRGGFTCVSMLKKGSLISIPAAILSQRQYKVIITALRLSGNGALVVDFFGNQYCDGPKSHITIESEDMKEYSLFVNAPSIPNNTQVSLRVWKPTDATGNVIVKAISYALVEDERDKIKQTIPQEQAAKRIGQMKFRPYDNLNLSEETRRILVRRPEDVPKVSIITPTREGLELLKKCYEALVKNTYYPNWEWVIGDSSSTDGTAQYIQGLNDSRIKLVERNTTDGSFSSINNELVGYASGEYLLFLNNDTEPQPFWLYELMGRMLNDRSVGVVGAKLVYPSGKLQHAGIVFIELGPMNFDERLRGYTPSFDINADRYCQAVTGACFLMRRVDFDAVGGFDEGYYFCYEDVDLCLKIRAQLNKQVLYASKAVVIHSESITQKRFNTGKGVLHTASEQLFKQRWGGKVDMDYVKLGRGQIGYKHPELSFVLCVNDTSKYVECLGSLLKNKTSRYYEVVPVFNFTNQYSASKALNIGIDRCKSDLVVMIHQDVLLYENWIDMLFERIQEIEVKNKNWGVVGTAGINAKGDSMGVVYSVDGVMHWSASIRERVYPAQTVDEHCMVIRKSSGLRFDEGIIGFHFYGADLCLEALSRGRQNYAILCPIIHNDNGGSLVCGKKEFMRLFDVFGKKWMPKFPFIRTTTVIISKAFKQVFVKFKGE